MERIPIVVVYKKKWGSKHWIKVFRDLRSVDPLISTRSKHLPVGAEIVQLGVGEGFEKTWKKKYKIK